MGGLFEVPGAAVNGERATTETQLALQSLAPEEAQVLRLLFGIGNRAHSAQELALRLGVSYGCVRRMRARALRNLRLLAVPSPIGLVRGPHI